MNRAKVKRLAMATLGRGDQVDDGAVDFAMTRLTRSELKEYLAELKRETARRRVRISLSGPEGEAGEELRKRFAGNLEPRRGRAAWKWQTVVLRDESLGGGIKVQAGDDLIDASIKGLVSGTIDRLKGK